MSEMQVRTADPMILSCRECGHLWGEQMKLPMEAHAFVARLKGWAVCPSCGGGKTDLLFGEKYKEARKRLGLL